MMVRLHKFTFKSPKILSCTAPAAPLLLCTFPPIFAALDCQSDPLNFGQEQLIMDKLMYLVPVMGVLGLLYTLIKFSWVAKQDAGTDRMKEISNYIAQGAMAFLKAEWKILSYFAIVVALLLGFMGSRSDSSHWSIAVAFIVGAFFSAL